MFRCAVQIVSVQMFRCVFRYSQRQIARHLVSCTELCTLCTPTAKQENRQQRAFETTLLPPSGTYETWKHLRILRHSDILFLMRTALAMLTWVLIFFLYEHELLWQYNVQMRFSSSSSIQIFFFIQIDSLFKLFYWDGVWLSYRIVCDFHLTSSSSQMRVRFEMMRVRVRMNRTGVQRLHLWSPTTRIRIFSEPELLQAAAHSRFGGRGKVIKTTSTAAEVTVTPFSSCSQTQYSASYANHCVLVNPKMLPFASAQCHPWSGILPLACSRCQGSHTTESAQGAGSAPPSLSAIRSGCKYWVSCERQRHHLNFYRQTPIIVECTHFRKVFFLYVDH